MGDVDQEQAPKQRAQAKSAVTAKPKAPPSSTSVRSSGDDVIPAMYRGEAGAVEADDDGNRDYQREQTAKDVAGFGGGWNEARESAGQPTSSDPFGGGHGDPYAIGGKERGEQGFGGRLLEGGGAAGIADAAKRGARFVPATPYMASLDQANVEQSLFIAKLANTSGDPAWVVEGKKAAEGWATGNMAAIERYKVEQMRWASAHGDWCPIANAADIAMSELVQTGNLMGFDMRQEKETAAFVMGIEKSLDMAMQVVDAKMLGGGKRQSWSTHIDDWSAQFGTKAQPELKGQPIDDKIGYVKALYRSLQDAHNGVTNALLQDRADSLAAQAGKIKDDIDAIDEVIAFWGKLGGAVGGSYKRAKDFANGKTAEKLNKKLGNRDGRRYARSELKQAQDHAVRSQRDDSYQDEIDAQAHAANYEDHHDAWGAGGPSPAPTAPDVLVPDLSIGGLFELGAKLANHEKLEKLKTELERAQRQAQAADQTLKLEKTTAAIAQLGTATKNFEDARNAIGKDAMRRREQDVVNLGSQLDAYASEHAADLEHKGLGTNVPANGRELYATAMACVAAVKQYRTMSKLALDAFPYNAFMTAEQTMERERSGLATPPEVAGMKTRDIRHVPPRIPPLAVGPELEVYQQIQGSYLMLMRDDTQWSIRLASVEKRFELLLSKLSGFSAVAADTGTIAYGAEF